MCINVDLINRSALICNIKVLKKITLFFLITGTLLATTGWLLTSVYEKQVIASFQNEINKYLNTKIDADINGLSIWESFPNVSIIMRNVKINGSLEDHQEKLAELDEVRFTINLLNLIRKEYKIETAYISEGFINVYVNADGKPNYLFLKENKSTESKQVQFDFNDIHLENVQLNYENKELAQEHRLYFHSFSGEISIDGDKTAIHTVATCDVEEINIDNTTYVTNKPLILSTTLQVNTQTKNILLENTNITIASSAFKGEGNINYGENQYLVTIKAKEADFASITALLPNTIHNTLQPYHAKGKASFDLMVKKTGTEKRFPSINLSFGCNNVTLDEPNTKRQFSNLTFKGSFSNGTDQTLRSSVLTLENITGKLDGIPFQAKLKYQNFETPSITSFIKGEFPLDFLLSFSDSKVLLQPTGKIALDLKISGMLKDFEKNNTQKINSSGELVLKNIAFKSPTGFYNVQKMQGTLLFNQHDIAISDCKGIVNNADFNINGFLKGFFGFVFTKEGKMIVNADLKSNYIDFDQLIETSDSDVETATPLSNDFLQNIQFSLKTQVKQVKWGAFRIQNASGVLLHKNRVFTSPKLSGEIGGGGFHISGNLDTRNKEDVILHANTSVNGIHIDSIFHYFNNFNQDFITHKNVKGKVYLESVSTMHFDQYLNVEPASIVSNINAKITNGQLIDFEPMQNLSTFIDASELRNISFSELQNTITIANEKIEFPEMVITSSASNLSIRGWHTFEQNFYYKLRVPLKNLNKSKRAEAQEAVEESINGPILHLIISGNVDDFTIKYDKKATKEVIEDKVKEEVKEVRDLIRGTYQEEEEEQIGLEEEYFEFETDSIDE